MSHEWQFFAAVAVTLIGWAVVKDIQDHKRKKRREE